MCSYNVLIVVFFVVSIIFVVVVREYLSFYFSSQRSEFTEKSQVQQVVPQRTKASVQIRLYQTWDDFQQKLFEFNIDYWAVNRTCLSVIRTSALSFWDDEIHIGLTSEAKRHLDSLLHGLNPPSTPTIHKNDTTQVTPLSSSSSLSSQQAFPQDVHNFELRTVNPRKFELTRFGQPEAIFLHLEKHEMKGSMVAFGPSSIRLPREPVEYLDRNFPLWAVQDRIPGTNGKFVLTPALLAPHPGIEFTLGNIRSLKIKSYFYKVFN